MAHRKLSRERIDRRARELELERMSADPPRRALAPAICIADGCTKPQFCCRLCTTHYERKRKGQTMDGQPITALLADTAAARFLSLPRPRA